MAASSTVRFWRLQQSPEMNLRFVACGFRGRAARAPPPPGTPAPAARAAVSPGGAPSVSVLLVV